MKNNFKVGDIVMTIKGPKKVVKVKKEVVIFDDGFAPKDMVFKVLSTMQSFHGAKN